MRINKIDFLSSFLLLEKSYIYQNLKPMKKIALLFSIIISSVSFAQTVNDVPIKDINVDYVQIIGTGRGLSTKLNVRLDFGQDTKSFSLKNGLKIKDERGIAVKFNSMMDALNFMSSNGFDFQFAYTSKENDDAIYYILKKRK